MMTKLLKMTALTGLIVTATLMAQTPYDEGQKALREQRWMDAAAQFEEVIRNDRDQADAATYWRAYAFAKAGRRNEAERELGKLERRYPDSSWVQEGAALRIEIQGSEASLAGSGEPLMDEELRLFALAQLIERDPERALPLLQDLVQNAESEQVRRDALFVMAVNEAPEAREALARAARDSSDPDLQRDAIHMLGTMDANEELKQLYPELQGIEARTAVIEALSIADETEMLKQLAENETNPELRRAAIQGIGISGDEEAVAYLEALYGSAASLEEKQIILEAIAIAGDSDALSRILRAETDQELQASTVEALAIAGDDGASEQLVALYPTSSHELKMRIIESMMILDDGQALMALMQQESDPELKRHMLQMLTAMGSEETDEYLFEMLENRG